MTDDNILYDSIEASFDPNIQQIQNPYPPTHNPKFRSRLANHGPPGVSDSFDYQYVDVNGDYSILDPNPTTERYPLQSNQEYQNDDAYGNGYPTSGQEYLADDDTLPTEDPSFYYDSVDATAMGYGGYNPAGNRYVNETHPCGQQNGPQNYQREVDDHFYPHSQFSTNNVHSSVMQDSLEVTNNDFSRYEDVNAAIMTPSNINSNRRSQQRDRSLTINEPTMSFGSTDAGQPVYTGQPYYNPDADAHQHAMNIQSSWRGYHTRKTHEDQHPVAGNDHPQDESRYEDYNTRLPEGFEPSQVPESYDHDKHATVIQKNYKGYRARKDYKAKKERAKQAKVIQSSYRGYKARKKFVSEHHIRADSVKTHFENEDDFLERDRAAVKIQSNYKGHKTRKALAKSKGSSKAENEDVEIIQAAARGRKNRKEANDDQYRHEKATVIQANYRGYKTRKDLDKNNNEEDDVQVVQAAAKGYKSRKKFAEEKEQNQKAIVIQANYRGYRARKDLKGSDGSDDGNESDDARVIQAAARGYKSRTDIKGGKESDDEEHADIIQARVRGYQDRKELEKQRHMNKKATVIQSHYRGYRARKGLEEDDNGDDVNSDDVGAIQAGAKGYQTRQNYSQDSKEADVIQAHVKGYQTRKERVKDVKRYDSRDRTDLGSTDDDRKDRKKTNDEKDNAEQIQASVKGYQVRKKYNEDKNMEAAWDRNRRLQQQQKREQMKPNKGQIQVGPRKYTEYLDHNQWAKRQEKKKSGEPVSRLPTVLNSAEGSEKRSKMQNQTPSKNSNVSFSEPYHEQNDVRSYPKSPIPPNTREFSDITSVYSEDESVVQKRERERLKNKLLKKEKSPRRVEGTIPNKDELRSEILAGDSYREQNGHDRQQRNHHKKEKVREKHARKPMVRDFSAETLDSNLEDDESLYEFDPQIKKVQEHQLRGYHKKPRWIKQPKDSEEETYEDEEDESDDGLTSDDQYGYYGNGAPMYPQYPGMNGMPQMGPPGGHPHVAFVPVPWGNMHPLEQTLYASQMGPGGMPMFSGQYPQHMLPQQQQQQDAHGDRNQHQTKIATAKKVPAPPPGKDFVEKNKSKAVQREQEKGSYKHIALKTKKVKSEPEVSQTNKVEKAKETRKSKETGLIEARTTASDNHHVKVDINLNIPPEQLAAMLGIDPSTLSPRQHFTINTTTDKSPDRRRNAQQKAIRESNEAPFSNRNQHEQERQTHRRNVAMQEPMINNYTDERRGQAKPKEPNPYSKIPPIPQNAKNQRRNNQDTHPKTDVSPQRKQQQMQNKTPSQQPPKPVFYKPYTLEDYKNLNLDVKLPVHLGPEFDKIEERRKVRDKQSSYAKVVHEQNMHHIKTMNKFEKPSDIKQNRLSRRKVGLEYSKSVPKPKQPEYKNEHDDDEESPPMTQDMQRLEELKRRHEMDKSAVASTT